MTHWRKIVSKDSPHLNVWDIDGKSPVDATMESTFSEGVRSGEADDIKTMLFVRFKGGKKPFGVNVTNCKIIEAMHGPNIEEWVGKRVTLRTARCKGEPCIRINAPAGMKFGRNIPKFTYTDKPRPAGQQAAAAPPAEDPPDPAPDGEGLDSDPIYGTGREQ